MDYTPNTPEIRSAWVYGIQGSSDPLKVEKEFDRWLEEHDRQVAEKAYEEAKRDLEMGAYHERHGR